MDESMKQFTSEREAWRALSDEDRAGLRGKYRWWRAEDFFAGSRELYTALAKTGGDMAKCQVRMYDGFRVTDKGERRTGWLVAVNEVGEEIAAYNIIFNCPPDCPEA